MEKLHTEIVTHEFKPVFDTQSKILMLGTMPSPKSREVGFYYGHPRNRFWGVVSDVCGEEMPRTIEEKFTFAKRNHIAVWDVLKSCEIRGADDGSIRNPIPNEMSEVLSNADIRAIFTTGTKATALYKKYCFPKTGIPSIMLPSTSPANCRTSYETLFQEYRRILQYIL